MARNEIHNVAYFPFYCKESKCQFIIERKYGNDGYAVWVKLLRELAIANDHYLLLDDIVNNSYIASKCLVTEEILNEMIEYFCKIEIFDLGMWLDYKCLYSQKLVESLEEAYKRRSNKLIDKKSICKRIDSICKHLSGKCIHLPTSEQEFVDICTQRKEKKRKEKEIKVNEIQKKHWITDFITDSNFINVTKLKTQLNEQNCIKLDLKYKSDSIKHILNQMENYANLAKKYESVYLTANNWLDKPENIKQFETKKRGGALVQSVELFEPYTQLTD